MKKSGAALLVFALFIASVNLRPAINSISPLLETLRNDLGMSAATASLLTSIPVLCMGIFSPPAAKLGARYGFERIICLALALIGIGTGLRLITDSAVFLLVTAFLAGVGIAATGPLLSGFIKKHFPNQVPAMISVYTIAIYVGATLSSGLSAPMQTGTGSWQSALAIWTILALVAVPVWWFFVLPHVGKETGGSSSKRSARFPWRNKKAWLLTLSFGCMGIIFYSVTAWLPPIIQGMGYGKLYAANALTVFAIVHIPATFLLPFIMKRFPSRLFLLLLFSSLELIGFLMIYFSLPPWIAAAFLGAGAGPLFSVNLMLPIDATDNAQDAATWSAMIQSVGYVIGATGPLLLGSIQDATGSFVSAVVGLIGINLIMMTVHLFVHAEIKKGRSPVLN